MQTVKVVLSDEKSRSLRYPLSAIKRIKLKYAEEYPRPKDAPDAGFLQHPVMQALTQAPEEVLPYMLMEGLVEKDGLTEQRIADELLDGPMMDDVTLKVIEAFFGQRQSAALASFKSMQDAMVQKIVNTAIGELSKSETTVQ